MRIGPMRIWRLFSIVGVALVALLIPGSATVRAARDIAATGTPIRLELLVLEVSGCNICSLVRTHIQSAYERSPHARTMPLRYVDVTTLDETRLGLKAPIDTVPTIVLMREGKEVDRITGYVGPELFFRALSHILQQTEE